MTYKIENGAYVKDIAGGFEKTDYIDEVVQACVAELKCRLSSVYTDKDFGIDYGYGSVLDGEIYNIYNVRRALAQIDGVFVKSVENSGSQALINLLINDCERQVTIKI
ncbi:MAG: hypothetical protein ACI4IQ_07060 [Eubacterium sp.]